MRKTASYAGISAALVGLSALFINFTFEPPARSGIWVGLAAAWVVSEQRPASLEVVCRDRRLVAAAEREGFSTL